jgi:lysophospholipase L1-like esterase
MKKVLLIGDSISLDYGPQLRSLLREDIAVFSREGAEEAYKNLDLPIGGNGGDSRRVLDYVTKLDADGKLDADYFFFNCGLHDIKRERPEEHLQIDECTYRANLQAIVDLMKKRGICTVFITTTQADGTRYKPTMPFTRRAEDVLTYNAIAKEVMEQNGLDMVDLFAFTDSLGRVGNDLFRDHTHFLPDVITLHAKLIADAINAYVK